MCVDCWKINCMGENMFNKIYCNDLQNIETNLTFYSESHKRVKNQMTYCLTFSSIWEAVMKKIIKIYVVFVQQQSG